MTFEEQLGQLAAGQLEALVYQPEGAEYNRRGTIAMINYNDGVFIHRRMWSDETGIYPRGVSRHSTMADLIAEHAKIDAALARFTARMSRVSWFRAPRMIWRAISMDEAGLKRPPQGLRTPAETANA